MLRCCRTGCMYSGTVLRVGTLQENLLICTLYPCAIINPALFFIWSRLSQPVVTSCCHHPSRLVTRQNRRQHSVDEVLNSQGLSYVRRSVESMLVRKTTVQNNRKLHVGGMGYACMLCNIQQIFITKAGSPVIYSIPTPNAKQDHKSCAPHNNLFQRR